MPRESSNPETAAETLLDRLFDADVLVADDEGRDDADRDGEGRDGEGRDDADRDGEGRDGEGHDDEVLDLTAEFRADWRRRMDHLRDRDPTSYLGLYRGTDPDALEFASSGLGVVVAREGEPVGRWPSEAAMLADVAAYSLCDELVAGWHEFPSAQRDELVARLRAFMNRCPACGEAVVARDRDEGALPRLRCEGCEATLLGEGRE